MTSNLAHQHYKVPLHRRAAAFAIDFALIWLLSSIISGGWLGQSLFFLLLWLGMRVFLVVRNKGQSIGRYALDMRIWDTRWQRTPRIEDLVKRETLLGVCAALALQGLEGITSQNATVLLLLMPLVLDGLVALTDMNRYQRAFHDQIGNTIIIGTNRGYSLDIKLRLLLDKVKDNLR